MIILPPTYIPATVKPGEKKSNSMRSFFSLG